MYKRLINEAKEEVLRTGEQIFETGYGRFAYSYGANGNIPGILAATDRGIIFYTNYLTMKIVERFTYDEIDDIRETKDCLAKLFSGLGKIIIFFHDGYSESMSRIQYGNVNVFINVVRKFLLFFVLSHLRTKEHVSFNKAVSYSLLLIIAVDI